VEAELSGPKGGPQDILWWIFLQEWSQVWLSTSRMNDPTETSPPLPNSSESVQLAFSLPQPILKDIKDRDTVIESAEDSSITDEKQPDERLPILETEPASEQHALEAPEPLPEVASTSGITEQTVEQAPLETEPEMPVKVEKLPAPVQEEPVPKTKPKTEVHDLLELKGKDVVIDEAPPKSANLRQRRVSWSSFLIGQSVMLIVLVVSILWLQATLRKESAPAQTVALAPASAEVAALQSSLSRAQDQILALQKQIDSQSKEREHTQESLQEMADRMALVIKQASHTPGTPAQALNASDAPQVAAMMPPVTPATSELILLKERNRLTEYADKAIATGARDALQAVVEAMFDPQMPNMQHAAGAEFRRVQAYFEISSSIDPGYKLPLQELFKGGSITAEADLKPSQLIKLLHDHQLVWEVRLRSAYLLRGSADPETNDALLKTIRDDPSLDVVKQAQTSFEKRVGQRFRLFDIPSIEAWWAAQTKK
jgi:hypothetical protein